ncbi:MAG TPA: SAM-dependent methyltransferase [Actinocrinis sp.]|uniref:SAM-dependent methyltransferase n=1 Tax=Actinocrinis sp. TaxID=1920516 RepID=UPI002D6318C9|nr:SAM-dependent methyltransferase [Actinocrinis sp.]HZU54717.1 SAM-dependent methyltransferase [Actinocrinis sp.]
MSHRPAWAPDEIDLERPAPARMYDYYLGGSHNFAADRELAEKALGAWPELPQVTRANRAFLRRAVTFLAGQGIEQFLDLGSGIPTVGNVHEIVAAVNPRARTVYVDSDPVAVAHSRVLLAETPNARFVHADLRDPERVLADPALDGFLDLGRPLAVLMFAVLHFVPDSDDPAGIVAAYRRASVAGSYLAVSHGTRDYFPERIRSLEEVYSRSSATMTMRSHAEIMDLMSGYELVPPGLTDMTRWRPDEEAALPDPLDGDVKRYSGYGAVGRLE